MDYVGVGIGFAFAAMLCWGFGDFLIQRSCRAAGDWEALFVVGLIGAVIVSPFIFAMTLAPIAITVALSESYIIVAVILGLAINKEKLERHQKFGLVLSVFSAITLAVMTVK